MQFSDRNCKALNIITFVKLVRDRNGNGVKEIDKSNHLQRYINRQFFINQQGFIAIKKKNVISG